MTTEDLRGTIVTVEHHPFLSTAVSACIDWDDGHHVRVWNAFVGEFTNGPMSLMVGMRCQAGPDDQFVHPLVEEAVETAKDICHRCEEIGMEYHTASIEGHDSYVCLTCQRVWSRTLGWKRYNGYGGPQSHHVNRGEDLLTHEQVREALRAWIESECDEDGLWAPDGLDAIAEHHGLKLTGEDRNMHGYPTHAWCREIWLELAALCNEGLIEMECENWGGLDYRIYHAGQLPVHDYDEGGEE